jgi:hypothetical protein
MYVEKKFHLSTSYLQRSYRKRENRTCISKRKKSGFLTVHSPTALRTRSLRIKCVCKESLTNIVKKIPFT